MTTSYSKQAFGFMRKLDKKDYRKIKRRISRLKLNPYPAQMKVVKNNKYLRIRIGKYRIFYEINDDFIGIIKIERRERAY